VEWARRLRTLLTGGPGPLSPAYLDAAESAVPPERLAEAVGAWRESCAALLLAFSPDRREDLARELDDYQAGNALLEAMFNDTTGRDEWHAHQVARARLAALGLDSVARFCVEEQVAAAQLPQVAERALLQAWSEYQIRTDPVLAPLRAAGADQLLSEYQRLEATLTSAAAEEIGHARQARRPRGGTRDHAADRLRAALRKHVPVRELIGHLGEVAQAVKPCFLVSPLAVSQCLPPGMRFDVVIFDEASQVSLADAVNCIYRGDTLVLAGDQRQLPPATLSAAGHPAALPAGQASAVASVFDLAKESPMFGGFGLRCHYRSQHESLIAFSNAAFYEGRLIPLPGGEPGAGVEFRYGEGDSAAEAARVARRVIHHFDTRPELSLGVVTFSQAQARAIETALSKARGSRPELDRFFGQDRLRGFFVKDAEHAQGDERDVVIVSLGCAPGGQDAMDFGPLDRPGGWRDLNVAITRARYRTEVVSSIHAADIPEPVPSEGLRQLRAYLGYVAATSAAP
jgi:hypothetical protein